MGPRTHTTRSADGTGIAYWTLGEGPPLVYLAGGPWAHVELWALPACREWYRLLGRTRRLVRYDVRGTGRSDREVADFSLEAQVEDVEAVIAALALERFDVFAAADAGPVALELAARQSGRVNRLALWCAWARSADISSPRLDAWRALVDQDWTLMTDTCAHLALGWSGGEEGRRSAAHLRASVSAGTARAALAAGRTHDVAAKLPSLDVPVLVLHRRGVSWVPEAVARALARALPDARLVLLEGESTAPWLGDRGAVIAALSAFFSGDECGGTGAFPTDRAPVGAPSPAGRGAGRLTRREREVLHLLAGGHTNREIAEALGVSVRTVDRHVGNVYGKIGARSRVEATAWVLSNATA